MPWRFGKPKEEVVHRTDRITSTPTDDAPTSSGDEKNADNTVREKSASGNIDVSTAADDLQKIQKAHQFDPNLSQDKLNHVLDAAKTGDIEEILETDREFSEDSPYESVRAAVRNTDGEEPANTVRAWILGMIFVTIGSGLNMFLSMRFEVCVPVL